jgi:hypothetical protein
MKTYFRDGDLRHSHENDYFHESLFSTLTKKMNPLTKYPFSRRGWPDQALAPFSRTGDSLNCEQHSALLVALSKLVLLVIQTVQNVIFK